MKTRDAFAFRELYQKCFDIDIDSRMEVGIAKVIYQKFLLKGFSIPYEDEYEDDSAKAANYAFKREKYKSDRAYFLVDRIQHHLARLKRLEFTKTRQRARRAALLHHYQQILSDMKESALNWGEFGRANWIQFKRIFAQEFGSRLRLARKRAGLSQEKIAAKINVSQEGYARYELGIREPPLGIIYELSNILNVSTDWLFCRIPLTD